MSRANPRYPFSWKDPRDDYDSDEDDSDDDDQPVKILIFLKAQTLSPLSETGEQEYEKYIQVYEGQKDPSKKHVSKELFGFLYDTDVKDIIKADDNQIELWTKSFSKFKKREKKNMATAAPSCLYDTMEQIMTGEETVSLTNEEKISLLDDLLQLVAEFVKLPREPISDSQGGLPMSEEENVSVTTVGDELDGSKVHRMMFRTGGNRMQVKSFEFPDRETESATDIFYQALGLDNIAVKNLVPHAKRLMNAQKCLVRMKKTNEYQTQNLFYFVLGELLKSFCQGYVVQDLTSMSLASTMVQVCGEYFDKQKTKKGRSVVTGSPPKCVKLKLHSDLAVIKETVQKEEGEHINKFQLRAFLESDVNIEMKNFKTLKGEKHAAKAQVCAESMMRASKQEASTQDRKNSLLCSLLCDSAGLCALIHEIHDKRENDVYYISRWENNAERMVGIMVWIVKLSERENVRFDDIFYDKASINVEPDEDWEVESPTKKRKTQPEAGGNPPPTIVEGKGNEEAEEEVESLVVSCDDSEEGNERSLVLSHALSKTLFGRDIPLSNEALGIFEKQNKPSRKFCLWKWQSSGVDSKVC